MQINLNKIKRTTKRIINLPLNTVIIVTDDNYFLFRTIKNFNCLTFPMKFLVDGQKYTVNRADVKKYFFNNVRKNTLTCYDCNTSPNPFTVNIRGLKVDKALHDVANQIIRA